MSDHDDERSPVEKRVHAKLVAKGVKPAQARSMAKRAAAKHKRAAKK